jgi:long-chain acyl-CoA synthetase
MPSMNEYFLSTCVAKHARLRPDHIALIDGAGQLTWAELSRQIECAANALRGEGLRHGDRVGQFLANGRDALVAALATWRIGCVGVPISPLLTPDQISAMLADAQVKGFVAGAPYADIARAVRVDASVKKFAVGFDDPGFIDWRRRVEDASGEPGPPDSLEGDDEAMIIYSSGTTGVPKGIVHTLAARHHMGVSLALAFRFDDRSVALAATPLASNATWMMILPTLLLGGTLVWLPAFAPVPWMAALTHQSVTHAFCVPVMLQALLATPGFDKIEAPRLRMLVSAGSALPTPVKQAVIARLGPCIFNVYGCTEGIGTVATPETADEKIDSVGQALPGAEIAILDGDGRFAEPGMPGEIIGWSPALMRGYHRRPDATAEVMWTDPHGRTWLRTGDIGVLDEQHYLTLKDRVKDMIVSGGLNVYPADIESFLAQRDDLLESAVIGIAHDKWGEVPAAIVRFKPGMEASTDELLNWVNSRVAKHQRLAAAWIANRPLPRNALGKVLKRELRSDLAAGHLPG